jgi:hypothetical protein
VDAVGEVHTQQMLVLTSNILQSPAANLYKGDAALPISDVSAALVRIGRSVATAI